MSQVLVDCMDGQLLDGVLEVGWVKVTVLVRRWSVQELKCQTSQTIFLPKVIVLIAQNSPERTELNSVIPGEIHLLDNVA